MLAVGRGLPSLLPPSHSRGVDSGESGGLGVGACCVDGKARSGIAQRPCAGIAGSLLPDEAVLDHQLVIRIGVLPEQVSELPVE
jgi:hypothetical protein